jgi:DNA-binding transcriptional ArsR family regulator
MSRSIGSLGEIKGKVKPEREAKVKREIEEHIPPVLSAERAATVRALKPFLRAVEDVNRVAILQELGREEPNGLSVLELSDRLMLSQPLTSWHLHILKRARLVEPTNKGRQRIYRLKREMLGEYKELFGLVIEF